MEAVAVPVTKLEEVLQASQDRVRVGISALVCRRVPVGVQHCEDHVLLVLQWWLLFYQMHPSSTVKLRGTLFKNVSVPMMRSVALSRMVKARPLGRLM